MIEAHRVAARARNFVSALVFPLLVIFALALDAGSVEAAETPRHLNVDPEGYSIGRYDPVAYFTEGRPVRGKKGINARYKGAKYAFASEQNRDLFLNDPDKYVPEYGGYCAYGVAHGSKSDVDPEVWEIVDGKLYLLLSGGTLSIWQQKKISNIQRADSAWKSMTD